MTNSAQLILRRFQKIRLNSVVVLSSLGRETITLSAIHWVVRNRIQSKYASILGSHHTR